MQIGIKLDPSLHESVISNQSLGLEAHPPSVQDDTRKQIEEISKNPLKDLTVSHFTRVDLISSILAQGLIPLRSINPTGLMKSEFGIWAFPGLYPDVGGQWKNPEYLKVYEALMKHINSVHLEVDLKNMIPHCYVGEAAYCIGRFDGLKEHLDPRFHIISSTTAWSRFSASLVPLDKVMSNPQILNDMIFPELIICKNIPPEAIKISDNQDLFLQKLFLKEDAPSPGDLASTIAVIDFVPELFPWFKNKAEPELITKYGQDLYKQALDLLKAEIPRGYSPEILDIIAQENDLDPKDLTWEQVQTYKHSQSCYNLRRPKS